MSSANKKNIKTLKFPTWLVDDFPLHVGSILNCPHNQLFHTAVGTCVYTPLPNLVSGPLRNPSIPRVAQVHVGPKLESYRQHRVQNHLTSLEFTEPAISALFSRQRRYL